jgi:hypothetical protein
MVRAVHRTSPFPQGIHAQPARAWPTMPRAWPTVAGAWPAVAGAWPTVPGAWTNARKVSARSFQTTTCTNFEAKAAVRMPRTVQSAGTGNPSVAARHSCLCLAHSCSSAMAVTLAQESLKKKIYTQSGTSQHPLRDQVACTPPAAAVHRFCRRPSHMTCTTSPGHSVPRCARSTCTTAVCPFLSANCSGVPLRP